MQSSDKKVPGVQEDRGPPLLSGTPRSATKAGYGYETQSRSLYSSGRRSLGPTGYRGSMTYSGNYGALVTVLPTLIIFSVPFSYVYLSCAALLLSFLAD